MKKILLVLITFATVLTGCETLNQAGGSKMSKEAIVKSLLEQSVKSAYSDLGTDGGYENNSLVKIAFPPAAQKILDNVSRIPLLGDKVIETFVSSMNSAAEVATEEAYDIFAKSISEMSITDAASIITGADDAATEYLKEKTKDQLKAKYQPFISAAIDKPLFGDKSTSELWNSIFTGYNRAAGLSFGLLKVQEQIDLTDYVLGKAMDGIFIKVAEAEGDIRKDPIKWAKTTGGAMLNSAL